MSTLISTRPEPAGVRDWRFPTVERRVAAGVTVIAAHLPGRALVSTTVVADAGAVNDPTGHEGLAQLTMQVLLRGARGLDETELAIAFERVGAIPSSSASSDGARVGLSVPAGLLPEAVALLTDVVRRPTLDATQVDEVRAATLDRLKAAHADAGHRVDIAARTALWTDAARYRVQTSGTADSLTSIDADAVRDFHAHRIGQAPVALILAGDLTGVDLDALATILAAPGAAVSRGATTPAATGGGRRIVLAPMKGAVQSQLLLVAPGPGFAIPDRAGLAVGQAAVLGTFNARVNLRLREELGYTYGARGSFARFRDGGWVHVGCSVRNEVTGEAITETIGVLQAVVDDGLTEAEVEQARENLVQKFPVQYDSAGAVAGALRSCIVHDLGDDERDEMLAALRNVTADEASASMRTHLQLDEIVVAVAGAEEVRDQLETTGIGPVTTA